MRFDVYFEFYGKKMKTSVEARDIENAKDIVRDRINFLSIRLSEDDGFEYLKNIFGFNK
ncbi:MAG TPA: hypothetical protein P5523_07890 [Bacteroidales bacterium]|nr:hypothetical protein [Bacteroidales bacterium]